MWGYLYAFGAAFFTAGSDFIMIAVKRLSLFFGVAFGGIFFHEEHIRQRLAGSLLMFAGVVLIAI